MKNKLIVAILYILLFSYLYSFQDYGLNIWDEGGYANGTLRTFNGQTALKDFNPNGYLPGRYLYGAFFFRVFGTTIQSLRIGVARPWARARQRYPIGPSSTVAVFT